MIIDNRSAVVQLRPHNNIHIKGGPIKKTGCTLLMTSLSQFQKIILQYYVLNSQFWKRVLQAVRYQQSAVHQGRERRVGKWVGVNHISDSDLSWWEFLVSWAVCVFLLKLNVEISKLTKANPPSAAPRSTRHLRSSAATSQLFLTRKDYPRWGDKVLIKGIAWEIYECISEVLSQITKKWNNVFDQNVPKWSLQGCRNWYAARTCGNILYTYIYYIF